MIHRQFRTIAFGLALLAGSPTFAETNECLFDSAGVKIPTFAKGVVKSFAWNQSNLEYRALLNDGSQLYIKYWACESWGLSAEMTFIDYNEEDDDNVEKEKIEKLAELVLPADLKSALNKKISKQDKFTEGRNIDIPDTRAVEFFVSVNHVDIFTTVFVNYVN